MQTKSWQIALIGLIPLIISNFAFVYSLVASPCQLADCTLAIYVPVILIVFFDLFATAVVLLLRSETNRSLGIAFSFASVFFILGLYEAYGRNIGIIPTIILVLWPVFFLTTAAVYGTVKKV